MKTLTLYKRVSTSQQSTDDKDGLKRQQRTFENFLSSFPDLDSYHIEEISDSGLSAYHGVNVSDKGGLGSYLNRVRSGQYEQGSILAFEEQSRLSRGNPRDVARMVWDLDDAGIKLFSIQDNRTLTDDDFGDVMTMLNARAAHEYSKQISIKVRKAKAEKQRQVRIEGVGTFGDIAPGWLKPLSDGSFQQIPEHVHTVQRIFSERFTLRSMASIAAGLNADNIPLMTSRKWQKKAKPTTWTQSMVKNILNNPRVIGTLPESARKGSDYPAVKNYYGDPIIPLEHWIAAQESMSQKGKKTVRDESNPYAVRLFKSLIVCSHCHHKMDVNGARGKLNAKGKPFTGSLTCRTAREDGCMCGEGGTRTPTMPMRLVEHSLTVNLFRDLKQADVTAGAAERIAKMKLELSELQELITQNGDDLASVRSPVARKAILSTLDKLGSEYEQKASEIVTEERKQQATSTETLDGLDLDTVDGRLAAQRVISKTISLIEVDTVTRTARITLRNGNILEGFNLDSDTTDQNYTMTRALDEQREKELTEITGIAGGTTFQMS